MNSYVICIMRNYVILLVKRVDCPTNDNRHVEEGDRTFSKMVELVGSQNC